MLFGLSFSTPWILAGLAVLPAIWWLLRVTPPAPRRVPFPPLRLLAGLSAQEQTPSRTPWWLLLLRMLVATLIVVALAEPIWGQARPLAGSGPLVLFVDNGWTAAHAWSERQIALSDAISAASRTKRPVVIVPSAATQTVAPSLLDAARASRFISELAPEPWLPDRRGALRALGKMHFRSAPQILWFSDGLDHGDAAAVARTLSQLGTVSVLSDAEGHLPLAVKAVDSRPQGLATTLMRSSGAGERKGDVLALGPHGETLATTSFRFSPGVQTTAATLRLPLELRNEIQRIAIANEDSAGAVRLLDISMRRRSVGLVSSTGLENEQPLLSDIYYLERALSPYADLHKGNIEEVLSHNASVLVLADIGRISGSDHDRVAKFVSDGGVLVRFAGSRMTQGVDDLIPVKLRSGGRYLGGALAWASPQHLAPFPESSPFRGIPIPKDVAVSRQVLAEPSLELSGRTWARLSDGTPLVTAAQHSKGWIVLFHVNASPAWSTLPLSGLYVDMLRRLLDLSGGASASDLGRDSNAVLQPTATLDGFGRLRKPPPEVLPIRGISPVSINPSPVHPPGFYGASGSETAVNTVNANTRLVPMSSLGLPVRTYGGASVLALGPPLLIVALLLLFADVLLSLALRGYLHNARRLIPVGTAAMLLLVGLPQQSRADDFDTQAALDTRLAYVITGVSDVDQMSKAGLSGLGRYLKVRTSYDPKEPIGVDLDKNDLAFFPLLYWPMDPRERSLSPKALAKAADYMRNGGTILFDTRDSSGAANAPGQQTLRRLVGKLDMPPLQPVPPDHVLRKAFYLLHEFPGRWSGGKVWVEALPPAEPGADAPARGGDNVSPVIIGSNDWAAAWAVDSSGQPIAEVEGGDQQREMAVRFGVNVVMYALTGNYKTDQVHAPALLERMGH